MWFLYFLLRIGTLALFCTLPFLFWPPPFWLVIFCAVMAGLIAAFGLFDPKSRLLRLIVTMVMAFLPMLGAAGGASVTQNMVGDDTLRDWLNFILSLLGHVTNDGTVLLAYCVVMVSLIGLAAWQMYLEREEEKREVQLRVISEESRYRFDPTLGAHGAFLVETRIVVSNRGDAAIGLSDAQIAILGAIDLEVRVARCGEAIVELGPNDEIAIAAGGQEVVHLTAPVPGGGGLAMLLQLLDGWIGRLLVPLPAKVTTAWGKARFTLWARAARVHRLPR